MSDKISCPHCNSTIFSTLQFCPSCGEKLYLQEFRNENLGDLYKILQVDPSAEIEVIEAAYKRLAAKYHPDVNKSPDAQSRMQDINRAYKILSKPETRRQYDFTRATKFSDPVNQKIEQPEEKPQERKEQSQTGSAPPRTSTSKPSPKKGGLVIFFVFLILFIIYCVTPAFLRSSTPTRTPKPTPKPTLRHSPKVYPTKQPMINNEKRTPRADGSDCISWNKISRSQVGRRICGYGMVVDVYYAAEYPQIISFSETERTFIIKGVKYIFEDVYIGECVVFEGILYENSYSLFMSTDDEDIKLATLNKSNRLYNSCLKSR